MCYPLWNTKIWHNCTNYKLEQIGVWLTESFQWCARMCTSGLVTESGFAKVNIVGPSYIWTSALVLSQYWFDLVGCIKATIFWLSTFPLLFFPQRTNSHQSIYPSKTTLTLNGVHLPGIHFFLSALAFLFYYLSDSVSQDWYVFFLHNFTCAN